MARRGRSSITFKGPVVRGNDDDEDDDDIGHCFDCDEMELDNEKDEDETCPSNVVD